MKVARILPDVTGLDKEFDYEVPDHLIEQVQVGSIVRVDLHARRVGGWVTRLGEEPTPQQILKPILKVSGRGPEAELFELAQWASVRWAAHRLRPFLVAASPHRAITALPAPRRSGRAPQPSSPATTGMLADGGGVLRLPPRSDVLAVVHSAVLLGPTLVVVAEHDQAFSLAARLRAGRLEVALLPDDWAAAAAGVDVVVGTRSAAWGPCAGLAAAVVIDEHDEALQEERTPTWHARDVVEERCARAGVPCVLVSPIPTLVAVETYAGARGVVHPPRERERAGWPRVTVVARTDEDPWKRSLLTSELIERLRDPSLRVICVSNTTGRARVLACRSCRSLVRCERCDAAVGLADSGRLVCRRCGEQRPPVCQHCATSRFANLRPGVTRLREELESAAARPVIAVTGADSARPPAAGVYVGTEAVLHRVGAADVVAFLEFDSEMLAPRFRAAEQALALIVRAGRLAPEVLLQTFDPSHEVVRAAKAGDPDVVLDAERTRRALLGLPPFGALARVSGPGAAALVAQLDGATISVGGDGGSSTGGTGLEGYIVRAESWAELGAALNATERPAGSRVRVEVDPARI